MSGLWKYRKETPEGKYLVQRRDGSVPLWPSFVLGARDAAAPVALRAYAAAGEALNYDPQLIADVRRLADEFEAYWEAHGQGDPDGPPHRPDDPETIEKMRRGSGA